MFDEGHLGNDPVKAQEEVDSNLAILDDMHTIQPEQNALRHVFQNVWSRLKQVFAPLSQLTLMRTKDEFTNLSQDSTAGKNWQLW